MCRVQRGTAAFELSRWFCMNRSSSTIMVQRRQGRTACRNVHIAQNKVHDDIYRLTLFSHHHHHPSIDIKQKEICKPILTLLLCILLCCLGFLTKAEGFDVFRFFFPEWADHSKITCRGRDIKAFELLEEVDDRAAAVPETTQELDDVHMKR